MSARQQAEALFFGSGVQELYRHWTWSSGESMFAKYGEWEAGEAPDLWAHQVHAPNPFDSERPLRKVITYSVLYTAAEMIDGGKADAEKPFHPVSAETGRACERWIHNDDLDLLDPHTIDEVLQVAVFGGVRTPHFERRERS